MPGGKWTPARQVGRALVACPNRFTALCDAHNPEDMENVIKLLAQNDMKTALFAGIESIDRVAKLTDYVIENDEVNALVVMRLLLDLPRQLSNMKIVPELEPELVLRWATLLRSSSGKRRSAKQ